MPEGDPVAGGSINAPQSRSAGDDAGGGDSASASASLGVVGGRDARVARSHRRAASADDVVAAMMTPSALTPSSPPPRQRRRRNSLDDGIDPIWVAGSVTTTSNGGTPRRRAPLRHATSLPSGSPSPRRQPRHQTTRPLPRPQPEEGNKSLLWDAARFLVGAGTRTTAALIGTPWHAAQRHFIPKIAHDFAAYYEFLAPHRVKAWVHVFSKACGNLVDVLGRTESGRELGESLVDAGGSAADWLSAAEVRQFVVDGMSLWVKAAEALRTPETREALQQAALLSCRAVDAASTGRAKQLYYDLADATWSAIELAADPATTVAVAEVTAHLCHALELESYLGEHDALSSTGVHRVRRRRERDRRVARTYGDDRFDRNNDGGGGRGVSTEDVILSSLGDGTRLLQRGSVGRASVVRSFGGENNGADSEVDDDGKKADTSESLLQPPKVVDTNAASAHSVREERMDLEENTVSSIADLTTESNNGDAVQDEGHAERTDEGGMPPIPANKQNEDPAPTSDTSHESVSADAVCDVQYLQDGIAARADAMRLATMVARSSSAVKRGDTSAFRSEVAGHGGDYEGGEGASGRDEDIEELERPHASASEEQSNPSETGAKGKPADNIALEISNTASRTIKYEERILQNTNEPDAAIDMNRPYGRHNSTEQLGEKEYGAETSADRDANPSRKPYDENIGSSQLFSNVYNGSMSSKRERLIETLLNPDAGDECVGPETSPLEANNESTASGRISRIIERWSPLASAAAGAGNEDGQDTLKQCALPSRAKQNCLKYPRSRIGVGSSLDERSSPPTSAETAFERYILCCGLLLLFVIVACIIWFILGCYGFYLLFLADRSPVSSPELIVRVVREVVHVTPDGSIASTSATQVAAEKVVNGAVRVIESTVAAAAAGATGNAEL